MNKFREITLEKFNACFGFSIKDSQDQIAPEENVFTELGLNVPAFKKMLIKNDMEEYTDVLLFYWQMQTLYQNKLFKSNIQSLESKKMSVSEYGKDLTEILLFLLDEKDGKNISITFQKSRNNITKKNEEIIDVITRAIKKEYQTRNLNLVNLTFEEAEEELLNKYDREWIVDYINDILGFNPHIKSEFDIENEVNESNYRELFDYLYDDEMVEKYADEHYSTHDISLEFLQNRLVALIPETKKKVGAKPKNDNIAVIGRRLSYLLRIDRFLENKECKNDIDSIKLTNKDYRFIHDFLVFLNLIEDYSIKEHTTTTPEKYIYTMLKQSTPSILRHSNVKFRISELKNKLQEQSI